MTDQSTHIKRARHAPLAAIVARKRTAAHRARERARQLDAEADELERELDRQFGFPS